MEAKKVTGEITMHDRNWEYTMSFDIVGCALIPIKSFYLLKNSKFSCYNDNNREYPSKRSTLSERQLEKAKKFRLKYDEMYDLNCGVYCSNCFVDSLILNANGVYVMMKQGDTISRGTWGKKTDRLVLHDIDILHDFEMLIGDNILMNVNAPFDNGSSLYYPSGK